MQLKFWKNLWNTPITALIGLYLIGNGVFFLTHNTYFKYPPFLKALENDDIVGMLFIITGLFFILIKGYPQHFTKVFESGVYGFATLLMGSLTIIETLHIIFMHIYMPAIADCCITGIIMILAARGEAHAQSK